MPEPPPDGPSGPGGPVVVALRVVVAALALVALATPVVLTRTSWREDVLFNGDEAVAALLPVEFGRGGAGLLFPDNAYQGVLEVPAYAALWWVAGADAVPMRVLHQAIWLAAVAAWFVAALWPARRQGRLGLRSYWWAAATVAGLLVVTSVVGWPVWFRIYPGYQLGALLGGLAALGALRAGEQPDRPLAWWWLAGVAAGLAVYAQPMHVAGAVVVGALALAAGRSGLLPRLLAIVTGGLLGVAPLLAWNLGHDWATLDRRRQPVVEHPDWSYPERVVGIGRTTVRVLTGGDQLHPGRTTSVAAVVVLVGLAAVAVAGAVVLATWRGRSLALLSAPVVMLAGLPVLAVMSLQADQRYAVGWWPALVVLVAAGSAWFAERRGWAGRAARAGLAVLVVAHLGVVAAGVAEVRRLPRPAVGTVEATADLAEDLRRCGVDAVAGSYWRVYPVVWASEARIDGSVQWGPQRLDELAPRTPSYASRIAVLTPPGTADVVAAAAEVTAGVPRRTTGWIDLTHPASGVRLALEQTDQPLPDGCVGPSGLAPTSP